jgi:hypothetical protein
MPILYNQGYVRKGSGRGKGAPLRQIFQHLGMG